MNEMIERVARAMWEFHRNTSHLFGGPNQDEDWHNLSPDHQDSIRDLARAAIEAMREPTEAIVTAGTEAGDNDCPPWRIAESTTLKWQAMIDAALK